MSTIVTHGRRPEPLGNVAQSMPTTSGFPRPIYAVAWHCGRPFYTHTSFEDARNHIETDRNESPK